jgi:hypothetical protein
VDAPPLTGHTWLGPVLELFMRALPFTFREMAPAPDTAVRIVIDGDAGGEWTLRRDGTGWALFAGSAPRPAATVRLSDDTAWRLFSKGLRPGTARERVRIEGDQALGAVVLGSLAVMA